MKSINTKKTGTRPWVMTFALSTILFLAGCIEPVARYQDARQAFSAAADLENADKTSSSLPPNVSPEGSGSVTSSLSAPNVRAETGYQTSLAILESIDSSGESTLAENDLLAEKLTLQALCLWKLGKENEFPALIERAKTASDREPKGDTARSRDSYVLEALPGLFMNDQAHRSIPADGRSPNKENLVQVDQLLGGADESALHYIQGARAAAERNDHPVQDYLVTCELAAYRNLQKAYYVFEEGESPFSNTDYLPQVVALLERLKKSDRTQSQAIQKQWAYLFGL